MYEYNFKAEPGVLYVVPTPIGNLGDITFRSYQVIQQADLILAEDTRTLKHLLNKYEIDAPVTLSYRERVHQKVYPKVKDWLTRQNVVVLTSDAGTPAISDPGNMLISQLQADGFKVEVLPGPTAITTALVKSGLPTDNFMFLGFPPRKKGKQQQLWDQTYLINQRLPTTFVMYESPHRIHNTLDSLYESFGILVNSHLEDYRKAASQPRVDANITDSKVREAITNMREQAWQKQQPDKDKKALEVCILKELTKIHEQRVYETFSMDLGPMQKKFSEMVNRLNHKGEFVIIWRWHF